jgi:hypothetical protein
MNRRQGTLAAWGLLLAPLGGCAAPAHRWPFPAVPRTDPATVLDTLEERTQDIRGVYAVLEMSFESPERSAVLDLVARYQRPGRLRLTAFKDLFVAAHGVFDLAIDEGRFAMVTEVEDRAERSAGALEDLGRQHPTLAAVAALRQAMFLPGWRPREALATVEPQGDEVVVACPGPSGLPVEWRLERRTLGVREARLRAPEGDVAVRYLSYREERGRYIPERFEIEGPGAGVRISGVLVELEINPDFGAEDFVLATGDAPDAAAR